MSGHRNWKRVETEKRIQQGGREDLDGRWIAPGLRDRKATSEARAPQVDQSRQAVVDYIHALARSDVRREPPPPVPKAVMRALGLQADQGLAKRSLRRRREYDWAYQKAAAEILGEAR